MSVYSMALDVWAVVAGAAVLVPFMAAVAHETRKAIECLRRDDDMAPVSSHPHSSAPSHPGY